MYAIRSYYALLLSAGYFIFSTEPPNEVLTSLEVGVPQYLITPPDEADASNVSLTEISTLAPVLALATAFLLTTAFASNLAPEFAEASMVLVVPLSFRMDP